MADVGPFWSLVLYVALAALWAGGGYMKGRPKGEPFDRARFIGALIWGALVAVLAVAGGRTFEAAEATLAGIMVMGAELAPVLGFTVSLDVVAKIVVRWIDERIPWEKQTPVWDLVARLYGSRDLPPPGPPPVPG